MQHQSVLPGSPSSESSSEAAGNIGYKFFKSLLQIRYRMSRFNTALEQYGIEKLSQNKVLFYSTHLKSISTLELQTQTQMFAKKTTVMSW